MDKVKEVTSRFGHIWDDITNAIIRPQRSDYTLERLGPKVFRISDFNNSVFERLDLELLNMRGMKIQCSWYRAKPPKEGKDGAANSSPSASTPMPCLVYLHGNCGSRMDGLECLWVLRYGMTLFTYDACGSGLSDGEYVSLGYYERQDLAAVCEHLRESGEVSAIGLWGRSMGAVTSIMYASKDPSIACIVADSPFSSLKELTEELVTTHASWLPNFVANSAVRKVRKKVVKRANFDFRDLNTLRFAGECTVPIFLFHGRDDDFVVSDHSVRISEAYGGSCLHRIVPGGHNSTRGLEVQGIAKAFMTLYMIDKVEADQQRAAATSHAAAIAINQEIRAGSPKNSRGSAEGLSAEEKLQLSSGNDDDSADDEDTAASDANPSGEKPGTLPGQTQGQKGRVRIAPSPLPSSADELNQEQFAEL